jgi:hypothetical protein
MPRLAGSPPGIWTSVCVSGSCHPWAACGSAAHPPPAVCGMPGGTAGHYSQACGLRRVPVRGHHLGAGQRPVPRQRGAGFYLTCNTTSGPRHRQRSSAATPATTSMSAVGADASRRTAAGREPTEPGQAAAARVHSVRTLALRSAPGQLRCWLCPWLWRHRRQLF